MTFADGVRRRRAVRGLARRGRRRSRGDNAALWQIDPDGDITRPDAGEAALGGRGGQHVYDMAVVDDGLVVVGSDHLRIGL